MKSTFLKSIAFFAVPTMLAAQDAAPAPQRITLPFSDPSRPKSLSRRHTDGLCEDYRL